MIHFVASFYKIVAVVNMEPSSLKSSEEANYSRSVDSSRLPDITEVRVKSRYTEAILGTAGSVVTHIKVWMQIHCAPVKYRESRSFDGLFKSDLSFEELSSLASEARGAIE